MRLGIFTAMTAEALSLSPRPALWPRGPAGKIRPGEVATTNGGALVILGGIGRKRAAAASSALLRAGAEALISWGCASGLVPGMKSGSLVLPELVISGDGSMHRADPELSYRVGNALKGRFNPLKSPLAESNRVLTGQSDKQSLFRLTGAIAADMESAAVAEAAAAAGVPFLSIRAIVDPLETTLPRSALLSIDDYGRVKLSRFFGKLAGSPSDIPGIVRLALQFHRAGNVLEEVGQLLDGCIRKAATVWKET